MKLLRICINLTSSSCILQFPPAPTVVIDTGAQRKSRGVEKPKKVPHFNSVAIQAGQDERLDQGETNGHHTQAKSAADARRKQRDVNIQPSKSKGRKSPFLLPCSISQEILSWRCIPLHI